MIKPLAISNSTHQRFEIATIWNLLCYFSKDLEAISAAIWRNALQFQITRFTEIWDCNFAMWASKWHQHDITMLSKLIARVGTKDIHEKIGFSPFYSISYSCFWENLPDCALIMGIPFMETILVLAEWQTSKLLQALEFCTLMFRIALHVFTGSEFE